MKLAYDIGGYDGADSDHYLKTGIDRVVCVEASPVQADLIRHRLAGYIDKGRLTVLNIGVGDGNGTMPFYVSKNPLWSSFDRAMAERAGPVTVIDIEMRKLSEVIAEHGPADFVKIDVEGGDFDCLKSLAKGPAPKFLSCEADAIQGAAMILTLIGMGYTRFNLVDQNNYRHVSIPAAGSVAHVKWSLRQWARLALRRSKIHGLLRKLKDSRTTVNSSASHGAGPTPMEHKGHWHSPAEFMALWKNVVDSGMIGSSWYDIHCCR